MTKRLLFLCLLLWNSRKTVRGAIRLWLRFVVRAAPFALTLSAFAQTATDVDKKLADLDKAVKSAQSAGDNAWMLTSAALVLMMTGPGLALFYSGLVRRKNVLGTMMHSFVLMGVVT